MGVNFFLTEHAATTWPNRANCVIFLSLSKLSFPLFSIHFFLFQISVMYTVLNFFLVILMNFRLIFFVVAVVVLAYC